jgi:predicted N-acyltransferase
MRESCMSGSVGAPGGRLPGATRRWAAGAARLGVAYYPKLLAAVPFTPVAGARVLAAPGRRRAVLDAVAGLVEGACRAEGLSSAHVNFCLPEETRALAARGWQRRVGYQYQWRNEGFASFEDYLAGLRSKRRNQVRRERRELAAQGVTVEVHRGEEIPPALMPRLYELYRTTIERLPWGQQYLTRRFFALVRERCAPRLCVVVARQGRELIAGTFNVEKGEALYGRYWGAFRTLRHLHFNVCYYAAIEYCIARGLRRFEPGAGGEFKHLRGFEPAPTESAHWIADPRLAAEVRRFLEVERRLVAREIVAHRRFSARRRDAAEPGEE